MKARLIFIDGRVILHKIRKNTTSADIIHKLPEYGLPLRRYELIFCGKKLEETTIISGLEDLDVNYIVVHEIENVNPIPTFNQATLREMIHEEMIRNMSVQIHRIPSQLSSNPAIIRHFNRRIMNRSSRENARQRARAQPTCRRSNPPRIEVQLPAPISNMDINQCSHTQLSVTSLPENQNTNGLTSFHQIIDLSGDTDE